MFSHVWSSTTVGIEAMPVDVEAHVSPGLPKYTVVGLPNGAVRESKQRVFSAIVSNKLPFPRGIVTVNLAPADLRKEGTAFDLPMAIALIEARLKLFGPRELSRWSIVGELALDGQVRPVRGVLSMAMQTASTGPANIIVPKENAEEAACVENVAVYPVAHLLEAINLISGNPDNVSPIPHIPVNRMRREEESHLDFADVRGQTAVKRALEVAAAGGHNILMVGPPGAGKTMLARRLPTILPRMSPQEALETTQIHSVGGIKPLNSPVIAVRPFRSPHHTISDAGLCGGGANPRPGEISLAHNGILFLDELPEFKRQVLEVMRQPLEEGAITISRAQMSVSYPARFMLVAGMNPCPCGHRNHPGHTCLCKFDQVQRYLSRISGPLMDRIDIHIEVTPVSFDDMNSSDTGERSSAIRHRVEAARDRQSLRFRKLDSVYSNARMPVSVVRQTCSLETNCQSLLKDAVDKLGLSARAFDRILKVARTIADLDGKNSLKEHHIAEAIQYRSLDRSLTAPV